MMKIYLEEVCMYIKDLYASNKTVMSFEVFPPKKESAFDTILPAIEQISALNSGFISVTYGAGSSGNSDNSTRIASLIKNKFNNEPLAHLTAINANKSTILNTLDELKSNGIENIMTLRGDMPEGYEYESQDFKYAKDLISFIKENGDFCVGAACYPEGHIDCENIDANYDHMLEKQVVGADFFVSQLFFENARFLSFRDKAVSNGITVPIVAGIMPILGKSQISRMIFTCGVSLPSEIVHILHRYENNPEDLQKAGIEYSCRQIDSLVKEGVKYIHVYSMNKPYIAYHCKQLFDSVTGNNNE